MTSQDPDELPPSKLGTKEYWDSAYEIEIKNFESHGDVGEVWFGDDASSRIIRWLTNTAHISKDDPVIDLGCGNGMMLVQLASEGFTNLTGVDYSLQAVELASRIANQRRLNNIKFLTCDITCDNIELSDYSVVLDKGTYDAISLNPEQRIHYMKSYKTNLKKLLRNDGIFVITSCNWTEEELTQQFESDFIATELIPAPKFQFGGKVGSTVTTVVFHRRHL